MIKRSQILNCDNCDAVLEVIHACDCDPCQVNCCGHPMKAMDENTQDAATEKHVPVIEQIEGGVRVTVGSTEHPMKEEHYIEWIEVTEGDTVHRRYLKPGEKPQAEFAVKGDISARELCNVHGLWKA
jgi:superoxide reductase